MEPTKVRTRIVGQIQHMVSSAIIKDRRFLDDEQLIRSEQLVVLEEVFNANVRDTEIKEQAAILPEYYVVIIPATWQSGAKPEQERRLL